MKISNNELFINDDVTDDVYEKIKSFLYGLDDIKLTIKDSSICLDEFEIPDAVSSFKLDGCSFKTQTKISNLNYGRSFSIRNCKKKFFTGNVTIQNIHCTEFNIVENYGHDPFDSLSPFIEDCTIDYLTCNIAQPPFFTRVNFKKKLKINSAETDGDHQLVFKECKFHRNSEIFINSPSPVVLTIQNCSSSDEIDNYNSAFFNASNIVIVKSLFISNSNLKNFTFSFFSIELKEVEIENSDIGVLELSTIDDNSNKKNTIYNMRITDSCVQKLNLKNRELIHEIDFSNTYFHTPPIIHGSNIPEGSIIPDRKYFIGKNGVNDASRYRALRFIMESQRNRDLEGMFFSLEQESLLNSKTKTKKYLSVSYLYYILSDYGTNYRTPLFILLTSIPLFTIIYSMVNSTTLSINLPLDWKLITQSFIMALKQTFLPFDLLRNNNMVSDGAPGTHIALILISLVNSIFSVSLLALSGLALRWKFKRG
ncbi:hypothetical protein HGT70_07130 [Rosenbergiella collisarenosi]|uniref:hypothetical protein n=1 Tax=Rosenbergiella collisarenosi TaxID=1544695 RepID=UPI001BD9841A|nr:hypothetical protein [Rosenbergiella collisarenosi]MBT0721054.1 hypothetical protein [Rosenbergiella collisarenosi]